MHAIRTWSRLIVGAALALLAIGAVAFDAKQPLVEVPHGNPSSFKWVVLPKFGGKEAIIYRSPDGTRVAAAFHESGSATFTYPFDEFLVVTSGSVIIKVHGGSNFTLKKGDVAYLHEGMTVDFRFSDDFSDVTCLVSNHEVKWR